MTCTHPSLGPIRQVSGCRQFNARLGRLACRQIRRTKLQDAQRLRVNDLVGGAFVGYCTGSRDPHATSYHLSTFLVRPSVPLTVADDVAVAVAVVELTNCILSSIFKGTPWWAVKSDSLKIVSRQSYLG